VARLQSEAAALIDETSDWFAPVAGTEVSEARSDMFLDSRQSWVQHRRTGKGVGFLCE
jgi:hypothetical protein